jgi:anti-anti-sigma factor
VSGDKIPFAVRVVRDGGVAMYFATGELDMATAPLLEKHLLGAADEGVTSIVVDLADVTFMDSSGLNMFIRQSRFAEENRIDFRVANPSGTVKSVFVQTGTQGLLAGSSFSELNNP